MLENCMLSTQSEQTPTLPTTGHDKTKGQDSERGKKSGKDEDETRRDRHRQKVKTSSIFVMSGTSRSTRVQIPRLCMSTLLGLMHKVLAPEHATNLSL